MKLFTVPNIITLANLACGCLAIVFAFEGNLVWSAYLVGIAAVLDFLDGFAARMLKQYSPIGKDLDSLADMVTFGVVPGIVMFQLFRLAFAAHDPVNEMTGFTNAGLQESQLRFPPAFIAFLITLFSALRLAKFNNDTRQTDSFIGVPTPANSMLICSLPLILMQVAPSFMAGHAVDPSGAEFQNGSWLDNMVAVLILNPWFLIAVTVGMSFLLISEIPLFALKVKSFGWKGNEIRYVFLALAVIMFALLKFIAIPLVIVLYVLLSVADNMRRKKV